MYELKKESGKTFAYSNCGIFNYIGTVNFLYSHVMYYEGHKYYIGHVEGFPSGISLLEASSHAFAVVSHETRPNIGAKTLCDFYMFKLKKKNLDVPSAIERFNLQNNLFIYIWKTIM